MEIPGIDSWRPTDDISDRSLAQTRGGQGLFKWSDVADDKDREVRVLSLLHFRLMASVLRWIFCRRTTSDTRSTLQLDGGRVSWGLSLSESESERNGLKHVVDSCELRRKQGRKLVQQGGRLGCGGCEEGGAPKGQRGRGGRTRTCTVRLIGRITILLLRRPVSWNFHSSDCPFSARQ